MQQQPRWDTSCEIAVRTALHRMGLRYRLHERPLPELRREADLVFRRARVAVFVDGCFWHGCPTHASVPKSNHEWWAAKLERNRRRDAETDDLLQTAGWQPIRVWEHEDADGAATRIADLVRSRTALAGR
jgi:DNA mismatch endonuclease (patch repair protein)